MSAAARGTYVPAARGAGMATIVVASTLSAVAAAGMHVSRTPIAAVPPPASSINPDAVVEPGSAAVNDPAATGANASGA